MSEQGVYIGRGRREYRVRHRIPGWGEPFTSVASSAIEARQIAHRLRALDICDVWIESRAIGEWMTLASDPVREADRTMADDFARLADAKSPKSEKEQ